jgi:hypothetical protein
MLSNSWVNQNGDTVVEDEAGLRIIPKGQPITPRRQVTLSDAVAGLNAAADKLAAMLKAEEKRTPPMITQEFMGTDGQVITRQVPATPPKQEYAEPTSYFVEDSAVPARGDELRRRRDAAKKAAKKAAPAAAAPGEESNALIPPPRGDVHESGGKKMSPGDTSLVNPPVDFRLSDAKRSMYQAEVAALRAKLAAADTEHQRRVLQHEIDHLQFYLDQDAAARQG